MRSICLYSFLPQKLGLPRFITWHKGSTWVIWRKDGVVQHLLMIQLSSVWFKLPFDLQHVKSFTFLVSPNILREMLPLTCIGRLFCSWAFVHCGCESWWHAAKTDAWLWWEADSGCSCPVGQSLTYLLKYIKYECGRNIYKGRYYRACIPLNGVVWGVVWGPYNTTDSPVKCLRGPSWQGPQHTQTEWYWRLGYPHWLLHGIHSSYLWT